MNTSTEQAIESLIAAFDAHPDQDAATVLTNWRDERDARRLALEARQKAMAQDALYTIGRVELVEFRTAGDTIQRSPRVVERIRVRYADIPAFAAKIGVEYKALMDVLEGRAMQVVGRGRVWRNGNPNASYVDTRHTAASHRAMVQRETAISEQRAQRQAQLDKIPTSFPEPKVQDWSPSK